MNQLFFARILSLLLLLLVTGCDKSSGPPEPIAVEELPGALEKTFAKATPEMKALAAKLVESLNAKDFPKAYGEIQSLSSLSGLSREQSTLVTRAVLCLNTALQTAQSNGDKKAAETLHRQRATK